MWTLLRVLKEARSWCCQRYVRGECRSRLVGRQLDEAAAAPATERRWLACKSSWRDRASLSKKPKPGWGEYYPDCVRQDGVGGRHAAVRRVRESGGLGAVSIPTRDWATGFRLSWANLQNDDGCETSVGGLRTKRLSWDDLGSIVLLLGRASSEARPGEHDSLSLGGEPIQASRG